MKSASYFFLWFRHQVPSAVPHFANAHPPQSLTKFAPCGGPLRGGSMLGAHDRYTTTIVIARRSRGNPYSGQFRSHSSYLLFRSRSLLRKLAHYRVLLRFAHQNSRLQFRSLNSPMAHKLLKLFGPSREDFS
jgi:hypothetical protein